MLDAQFIFKKKFSFILVLSLALLCSGCGTLKYLLQATTGQMSLITHARPVSEVLKDERVPLRTRELLKEISSIKKFGEQRGLKPTRNYEEFVKLKRNAAVYVVSACEPLKFKSKEWRFPFVGSFPYLGWFNLEDAKKYFQELEKEGWDVDLRGASAYSTLGWFKDAILSTMIAPGDEALGELANVVIHESVHATIYIKGQAYFNESLASFIANRLTYVYLESTKGRNSKEELAYQSLDTRSQVYEKKFHQAYLDLQTLYESQKSEAEKLKEKKELLDRLKKEVGAQREINNATLIQYATYNTGGEEFLNLLSACAMDWKKFMSVMKSISSQSFSKSQQEDLKPILLPFIQSKCETSK